MKKQKLEGGALNAEHAGLGAAAARVPVAPAPCGYVTARDLKVS